MERVVRGLFFLISDRVDGFYGLVSYFDLIGRHGVTISVIVIRISDNPWVMVTFRNDSQDHIDAAY